MCVPSPEFEEDRARMNEGRLARREIIWRWNLNIPDWRFGKSLDKDEGGGE